MKTKIGWNFPPNNDGEQVGLNDAGVETFKDNPLASLAREIAQNSCDAADPSSGAPVEVHFTLQTIKSAKFPSVEAFKKTLKACQKYKKKSPSTVKFFKNALEVVESADVRVLKVSDYNTTGLRGPVDDPDSDWFKLTKSVGASDKTGAAGGSFGIGKHAPFACSELRTVVYSSKDNTGAFAFQGVSKLVTHRDSQGRTTQGTGYFGYTNKNAPIQKVSDIPAPFKRTQTGTDVYILGFMRNDKWADYIAKGIIDSFFVAIQEGKLVAKVEDVLINATSLPALMTKYRDQDKDFAAQPYYQALTSEEAELFIIDDFEGLGRVELRVLTGKDLPKKVAMVRSTGMKIFDKGHIQTPSRFAGVFVAKGQKLNELLRTMEPPSHSKWEENRYEDDPGYAKSIKTTLYGWIADSVKSLASADDSEQLDAEGISQYLPDDLDDNPPPGDNEQEGEKGKPTADIAVVLKSARLQTSQVQDKSQTGGADQGDDITDGEGGGEGGGGDDGTGGGDGLGGDGDGSGGEGGTGDGTGGKGTGGGANTGSSPKSIHLNRLRVYCADPAAGIYRVMAEPTSSASAILMIQVVGEDTRDPAPIKSATLVGDGSLPLPVSPGKIGPVQVVEGVRISVDVVLKDGLRCALGVSAHES